MASSAARGHDQDRGELFDEMNKKNQSVVHACLMDVDHPLSQQAAPLPETHVVPPSSVPMDLSTVPVKPAMQEKITLPLPRKHYTWEELQAARMHRKLNASEAAAYARMLKFQRINNVETHSITESSPMNVDVPSQPVPAFPSHPMDTSPPIPPSRQQHPHASPTDHSPKPAAAAAAPSTSVAKSYIAYSKMVIPVLLTGAGLYVARFVVSKYLEERTDQNEARDVSSEEPVLPEKEEALAQFVEPPVQRTSPGSDILAPITDVPVRKVYAP